jgi:hypothetical protein
MRIYAMRPLSILMAIVAVLGFVSEAGARDIAPNRDFTVDVGGKPLGFIDWRYTNLLEGPQLHSLICLGPFGNHEVPFPAIVGFVGFCLLAVGMLALVTAATFRCKRKRAA